jgi:hypothetical protein
VHKDIDIVRDMIEGNLNRIAITDDLEEIESSTEFLCSQLDEYFKLNQERITKKGTITNVFSR